MQREIYAGFQGYGPIFMLVRILIVQPLFSLEDKLSLAKFPSVYFYVYLSSIRLDQVDRTPFSWINSTEAKRQCTLTGEGNMCLLFHNIPKRFYCCPCCWISSQSSGFRWVNYEFKCPCSCISIILCEFWNCSAAWLHLEGNWLQKWIEISLNHQYRGIISHLICLIGDLFWRK